MGTSLKHRWRVDQNYLVGITAGQWRRLLRENHYAVDPGYWHRAAFISVLSVWNSLLSGKDEKRYGREIDKMTVPDPPLFVLGHPRTGTTFLQNLLSRDGRFAYPNMYECLHPGSFLTGEDAAAQRWKRNKGTRPMDNVAFSMETPSEDEFALALSCLRSPNVMLNFPRHGGYYFRYLTFEGVPVPEVEEWKRALLWFAKKLTLRYRRPLVLKSPSHTARIRQLLEVFPEARFVNIHREPYTVFQSWRHTQDTAAWFMYLQKPPNLTQYDDVTLTMSRILFDAYFRQRDLIPAGRLVDVAYEDLEARPVETMEEIYAKLGLPDFEVFRPTLQAYVDSLGPYKKNRFAELEPALREKVAESWRPAFDAWGYPV
jgi:LPS sulfotransferase NodH